MRVLCPDGVSAGDALFVQTPDGVEITTEVPEGVAPGMEFVVDISKLGTDPLRVEEQTDGADDAAQQVFSEEQEGSAEDDWLDATSNAEDEAFAEPEGDNVLDELATELNGGDEDANDPFADLVSYDLSREFCGVGVALECTIFPVWMLHGYFLLARAIGLSYALGAYVVRTQ